MGAYFYFIYNSILFKTYFNHAEVGGQAKVPKGNCLGTFIPLLIKGCSRISSKVGLCAGSRTRIFVIKDLA